MKKGAILLCPRSALATDPQILTMDFHVIETRSLISVELSARDIIERHRSSGEDHILGFAVCHGAHWRVEGRLYCWANESPSSNLSIYALVRFQPRGWGTREGGNQKNRSTEWDASPVLAPSSLV